MAEFEKLKESLIEIQQDNRVWHDDDGLLTENLSTQTSMRYLFFNRRSFCEIGK